MTDFGTVMYVNGTQKISDPIGSQGASAIAIMEQDFEQCATHVVMSLKPRMHQNDEKFVNHSSAVRQQFVNNGAQTTKNGKNSVNTIKNNTTKHKSNQKQLQIKQNQSRSHNTQPNSKNKRDLWLSVVQSFVTS